MSYFQANQLLSNNQFGFRPGVSTTDAICTLIDDIGLNLNAGKLTIATFIDFSKAFDTLNHSLILTRLAELNINDTVLNWFSSNI